MANKINKLAPAEGMPRFTAAERTFIRMKLFDGLTGDELLKSFKHFFYPGNNYCATKRDVTTWKKRVFHINDKLDKSNEFKDLLKQAKTGLALKDARIANRKNALSRLEYLLTEYEGHKYSQMNKDWQDGFIKLCNLRIKELKDLAIELGEYKTTTMNFDQRKQLQVIQQQNVFGGQATVPHLEGDNATGLRIVAPSVEHSIHTGGSLDPPQQTNSVSREQVPGESQQDNNPHPVEASPAMPEPGESLAQKEERRQKTIDYAEKACGYEPLEPSKEVEQPPEEE